MSRPFVELGDGKLGYEGDTVWLYPADSVIGGSIETRVIGKVLGPKKFNYPQPDSTGHIGARAACCFTTKEAAEAQRDEDLSNPQFTGKTGS